MSLTGTRNIVHGVVSYSYSITFHDIFNNELQLQINNNITYVIQLLSNSYSRDDDDGDEISHSEHYKSPEKITHLELPFLLVYFVLENEWLHKPSANQRPIHLNDHTHWTVLVSVLHNQCEQ